MGIYTLYPDIVVCRTSQINFRYRLICPIYLDICGYACPAIWGYVWIWYDRLSRLSSQYNIGRKRRKGAKGENRTYRKCPKNAQNGPLRTKEWINRTKADFPWNDGKILMYPVMSGYVRTNQDKNGHKGTYHGI